VKNSHKYKNYKYCQLNHFTVSPHYAAVHTIQATTADFWLHIL